MKNAVDQSYIVRKQFCFPAQMFSFCVCNIHLNPPPFKQGPRRERELCTQQHKKGNAFGFKQNFTADSKFHFCFNIPGIPTPDQKQIEIWNSDHTSIELDKPYMFPFPALADRRLGKLQVFHSQVSAYRELPRLCNKHS